LQKRRIQNCDAKSSVVKSPDNMQGKLYSFMYLHFRKYCNPTTTVELIQSFGVRYSFRGRKNCTTFKKQFEKSPKFGYESWPSNDHRYSALQSSLRCNWKILVGILGSAWSKALEEVTSVAVDEMMFAFYSQTEANDCPQRYMPNKPHPNGKYCLLLLFII
jgi:hypothetical protein